MSAAASMLDDLLGGGNWDVRTHAPGPDGKLPLDDGMLRHWASGDLFGLSQNAGMGWDPAEKERRKLLGGVVNGEIRGFIE